MPSVKPKGCKRCPRTVADGFTISWHGLCRYCSEEAMKANNVQLAGESGPYYDHWIRRSYMKARVRVLDELQRTA